MITNRLTKNPEKSTKEVRLMLAKENYVTGYPFKNRDCDLLSIKLHFMN